jgi:GT2 family glycosyltransferase
VPTLGLSTGLVPCLEALREGGGDLEILLVVQGDAGVTEAERLADRVLRAPSNLGFAAANNLGLIEARGDYLATVNDDAIVEEGWSRALIDALERHPEAASAQGINVSLDDPTIVDGAGLAWNRSWQAVQIGHGRPLAEVRPASDDAAEIFGVSATAAIYRRSALERLGSGWLAGFEPRLFAYYEDVDLACRLRGLGYTALLVPTAAARHAGSVSGRRLRGGKQRLIYRNRQLVLARLLGRAFWPRWPRILLRDAADLWRAMQRGDVATAAGIVAGLCEASLRWPGFIRFGPPLVALDELRRFRLQPPADA